MIRSSDELAQTGDQISSPSFDTSGWYPATVPTTVIRALVSDGVYADPYYGLNLRSIPGTTYDFGDNFAVDPMPADSPFRVSWWYRTQFRLHDGGRHTAARPSNRRYWLNFDSINYRANIWLNGRQIAAQDQVRGMYRTFEFDVTDAVAPGLNTLAVEVFPPTENDLSISFVDWNPLPANKHMGLVRDVYLLATGPVALRNAQVTSALNGSLDQAQLTIAADLDNPGPQAINGILTGTIGDIVVSAPVRLAAGQSARITLTPREYPQLVVNQPRLWWPNGVGPQNLYQLHLEFQGGGVVTDAQDVQFGIRSVSSELDAQQHRVFRINGQRILIRGAAWTPDMMLKIDPEREDTDLRYARDMNLNAIRCEGKLEMSDGFFDLADRYGILLLPGWCCCSFWEEWDRWTPDDYTVAAESLRSQVRRLRNHPSVLAFLYGSDNAAPPAAEQAYLKVLAEENWPNPYIAGARDATTLGAGRTGVKMTGPYDYVPPEFWLADTQHGGAWGFNTETSPGPPIPLLESLQAMMPAADLWPPDNQGWNFHAGSGSFADTRVFNAALDGRYGQAKDITDYVRKRQAMTYEAERAMFEDVSGNLAFLVHLTVRQGKGGGDIAPVLWSDNYFELMPGEQREITATYASKLLGGATSYVQVDGWNVSGAGF
jgi:exo-1,4-beta-D-glucosaminidase